MNIKNLTQYVNGIIRRFAKRSVDQNCASNARVIVYVIWGPNKSVASS